MEYGLIFHGTRTVKYYCKNMKYRINIYISREISIEHPSVGLASLAQLYLALEFLSQNIRNVRTVGHRPYIYIFTRRRASSFLVVVFIHVNREEEGETEQQQFTKGCNILHRLQVHHLTLIFIIHNKYTSTLHT